PARASDLRCSVSVKQRRTKRSPKRASESSMRLISQRSLPKPMIICDAPFGPGRSTRRQLAASKQSSNFFGTRCRASFVRRLHVGSLGCSPDLTSFAGELQDDTSRSCPLDREGSSELASQEVNQLQPQGCRLRDIYAVGNTGAIIHDGKDHVTLGILRQVDRNIASPALRKRVLEGICKQFIGDLAARDRGIHRKQHGCSVDRHSDPVWVNTICSDQGGSQGLEKTGEVDLGEII